MPSHTLDGALARHARQLYNVVEQVCVLAMAPLVSLAQVQRAPQTLSLEVLNYQHAKQRFALQQDKDLQALPLTVSNTAAGVIVVKGAAPSAELAQKAIKRVQAVPGVKEVRNEIKVG